MKIDLKLPGGAELHYEKKPMGKEARQDLFSGLMLLCLIGAFLVMIWMLR